MRDEMKVVGTYCVLARSHELPGHRRKVRLTIEVRCSLQATAAPQQVRILLSTHLYRRRRANHEGA
jgi:hypothetical protein